MVSCWMFYSARRTVSYMSRKKSYYEILGVKRDASDEEIKQAFARKFQQLHPDGRHFQAKVEISRDRFMPTLTPTEQFMQLKQAYDVLKKPEKRKEYDREIRWGKGDLMADELTNVMLNEEDKRNLRMGRNVLRNQMIRQRNEVIFTQPEHFYDPTKTIEKEYQNRKYAYAAAAFVIFVLLADGIYIRYLASVKKNSANAQSMGIS